MKPAPPVTRACMWLSSSKPDDLVDGTKNDGEIHDQVAMFDVKKVIFKLDRHFLDGGVIAVIDLRPAGDTRFDQ